ncbi:MAG: amidohydrolase/deacetylase family metallohydrolase [Gemmatimonadetes bacterium]|nr:amidohydrolase/deacetylase family metallohydrolase [Gemmatimonadota bacterium]
MVGEADDAAESASLTSKPQEAFVYDLLIKGGHLIDPKNGIDAPMDLAISGGKVAAIDADIPAESANQVADVTGLYVTPGLVDIHTHMYATPGHRNAWAGDNSILPDGFSFRVGVTTMMDTGSAGCRTFEDFRFRVLDRFQTRMFALVNIVGLGMNTNVVEQNVEDMDVEQTAAVAKEHSDIVVGIKTAHFWGPEWVSVDRTQEAAERAGMPSMIDFGYFRKERPYHELVREKLRAGDISTHMYRSSVPWLDGNGRVLPYLHEARERGILFDVGHGGGSFVFRNAVPAVKQGFYPDSISTDLHTGSMNDEMMDMVTTMSKFLAMGMSLQDVIRLSTIRPAEVIGHPELGHLSVGAVADVAVLNQMSGRFGYCDVSGGKLEGDSRLICEMTVKDGRVVYDWNGRMGTDYRELGDQYGIRDVDHIVIPDV